MKVTILDMQPIDPPTGGGRLRLLGLYHALGDGIRATYVGTYDWPGPGYRRHRLSPTLEEIDLPLTAEHFSAVKSVSERVGKGVIDCVFHEQAYLSPEYLGEARKAAADADVVVFSHPWIHPLVRSVLDPARQLIVYDSHNVEGVLRTALLDDGAEGTEIARGVVIVEKALCECADLILACSQLDRLQFSRLYGVPIDRIKVIPNGVFVERVLRSGPSQKEAARRRLGLPSKPVATFLGSNYGPNLEAALYIAREVAPELPAATFVIAGGVGDGLTAATKRLPPNLHVTGFIDEQSKLDLLAATDIALNPMFSGSGTNIKMLDYMAAGLPTITTPTGARGIVTAQPAYLEVRPGELVEAVRRLIADPAKRDELGARARVEAERHYSWEQISPSLGALLRHHQSAKARTAGERPHFSVIVPTFDRPALLTRLLDRLAMQSERRFEVIVVDQSDQPWPGRDLRFDFELVYVHTPIRGAVRARNLAALLARGTNLAFTDDDCEPAPRWLESARGLLADPEVVGVEGLIQSARRWDPEWRAVTNKGFSGIGFMTANLIVRTGAFHTLNGFDIAFEQPHFREDTDFGWRLQALGRVPFSEGAWVFHPPHKRDTARESHSERATFFEKDALLLRKHPERYRELFFAEGHWQKTNGFWSNFLSGTAKYSVALPAYVRELVPPEYR